MTKNFIKISPTTLLNWHFHAESSIIISPLPLCLITVAVPVYRHQYPKSWGYLGYQLIQSIQKLENVGGDLWSFYDCREERRIGNGIKEKIRVFEEEWGRIKHGGLIWWTFGTKVFGNYEVWRVWAWLCVDFDVIWNGSSNVYNPHCLWKCIIRDL